jgi:hypothetical protein
MELLTFVAAVAGFWAWREGRRIRLAVPGKDASLSAGARATVAEVRYGAGKATSLKSRAKRQRRRRLARNMRDSL